MMKAMLALLCVFILEHTTADSVFPTTRNGDSFTNMIARNDVLVIAENGLLHTVDKDLNPIQNFSTCNGINCDNINKILLAEDGMLILGGTGNSGILQAWNGSMFVYNSSSISIENYLTVSSHTNRPAVGLVYEGNLYLGVTFGDGIAESDIGGSTSYRYLLSVTRPRVSFSTISYVYLKDNIHTDYIVYFRAVFRNQNFVYFLTNQKTDLSSQEYVTKLIRICVNETYSNKKIKSYTDITLSCKVEDKDYNLLQHADFLPAKGILIAAFTKGEDPENPVADNVICIYTIEDINEAILDAKKEYITCSSHDITNDASSYLMTDLRSCEREEIYNILSWDYICPQQNIGVKVIGKIDLEANSSYKLGGIGGRITKVKAIERYDLYPDVYLGTDTGSIIRLSVDDKLDIHQYANITTVDIGHIVTSIHADHNDDFIYVLTDRKLFKVDTSPCAIYKNYMIIVQTKDPSCGWCIEEYTSRSTKRTDCAGEWISSMSDQITIDVSPKYIAAGRITILNISTTNIPTSLSQNMRCRFVVEGTQYGSLSLVTVINSSLVQCHYVRRNEHTEMYVGLLDNGFIYAEEAVQIYKCNAFGSCVTCLVSEEVDCVWCATSLRCSNTCEGDTKEIVVKDQCTTLIQSPELMDLYLPFGVSTEIEVNATNLVSDITYKCAVNLTSGIIKVDAQPNFSTQTISCNLQVSASMPSHVHSPKMMVHFYLLETKGTTESIVYSVPTQYVTVYECENLAWDCTMCKALNKSRYDCEWCNGQCSHRTICNVSDDCPLPRITNIQPSKGGHKGGTEITISGTNFGNHPVQNIIVGNRGCGNIKLELANNSDFEPYVAKIHCSIARSDDDSTIGVSNVTVTFVGAHQVSRADLFSFQVPNITNITPPFLSINGGTVVTMSGTNLAIGNHINSVLFLSSMGTPISSCSNPVIVNKSITCTTSGINRPFSITTIRLSIDGDIYRSSIKFEFLTNPVVQQIRNQPSISSGGQSLTISGNNLMNAFDRRLNLHYAGSVTSVACNGNTPDELVCPVPEAPERVKTELAENIVYVKCPATLQLDGQQYSFYIFYHHDPVLSEFDQPGGVKEVGPGDTELTIFGRDLNLAANKDDYSVAFGTVETCPIKEISSTNLTCFLPTSTSYPNEKLPVKITLGHFERKVGYIIFHVQTDDENDTVILIVGIAVSSVLAIIILVGAIIGCRKYRRAKSKVPKIIFSKKKSGQKKSKNNGKSGENFEFGNRNREHKGVQESNANAHNYEDVHVVQSEQGVYEELGNNRDTNDYSFLN